MCRAFLRYIAMGALWHINCKFTSGHGNLTPVNLGISGNDYYRRANKGTYNCSFTALVLFCKGIIIRMTINDTVLTYCMIVLQLCCRQL